VPGRYALIVTTDTYGDPKLRRLRAPARDAQALADVLRDPEIGGFEVELAANESDAALRRRIAAFFSDRARDSLLLLHFSCHGLKDDSGQLYFAAADTEVEHLDATAIPAEFVSRQMARSRSNNVLMLLDCCYSGAIARGLRFRAGDSVDVSDHLGGSGRVIITASNAMEYAFEGDELTGEGRPSVFTSAVVKALETGEADRDQDSWISVRELYDYVCDEVREITPNQRPNMLSHLEGELYVARSRWVAPARLPRELLDGLASPAAAIREGAVNGLAELLRGRDRGLAEAARGRLESVAASDDSRRVSAAAAAALAAPEPVAAVAASPAPAVAEAAPAMAPPPVSDTLVEALHSAVPDAAARSKRAGFAASPRISVATALALVLLVAGTLLVWGWFMPWVWGDVSPARGDDVETDDALGFTTPLVAGVMSVVLGALLLARDRPRRPVAWLVMLAISACGVGEVIAYADHHGTEDDYNSGVFMTEIGGLIAAAAAGWRAWSVEARTDAQRVTPGDVVAAAGGLLIVVGVNGTGDILTWVASVPSILAGVVAIAAPVVAFLIRRGERVAALLAIAAGAFAIGAAGMAEAPGRTEIVIGGLVAAVGGALAFRARSQA
jgi:hypothetical protein